MKLELLLMKLPSSPLKMMHMCQTLVPSKTKQVHRKSHALGHAINNANFLLALTCVAIYSRSL